MGSPLDPTVIKELEEAESKVLEGFALLRDDDVLKMLEVVTKLYRVAKEDPEVAKLLKIISGQDSNPA